MKKILFLVTFVIFGFTLVSASSYAYFGSNLELKPILETWNGSLEQLNTSLFYACTHPSFAWGIGKIYYESDISNPLDVKFRCNYTSFSGVRTFWAVSKDYTKYSSYAGYCKYDFTAKLYSCPSSLLAPWRYFYFYWTKFPVPFI